MAAVDPLADYSTTQLVVAILVSAACSAFTAWDARRHGRSAIAWGVAGFLFGVFGVLAWLVARWAYRRAGLPVPGDAGAACRECRRPLAPDLAFCGACGAPREP